ncbi:hypothetical protein [Pseudomonas syringae]|uniref:hypothetical protein n=1 Tax=Pseudomonas syringae TaxID=317 RepID=UPI0024605080|nr:hypothetical protein [Pseudomonas syringae]MDH4602347.1 hypothetical protein [Pseudomonas syringae pv. papulans]
MTKQIDADRRRLLDIWESKLTQLFNGAIPEHAEWEAPLDIGRVLQAISGNDTHVYLPGGGGEDLAQCRTTNDQLLEWSPEKDRLDSYAHVVSPQKLTFWNPGLSGHEANFVLELSALRPVLPNQSRSKDGVEEVVELRPGQYAPRSAWDNSEFNGNPLPSGSRLVVRFTAPGRLAVFSKGSVYNRYSDTSFDGYNGHHNNPDEFKNIVEEFSKVEL